MQAGKRKMSCGPKKWLQEKASSKRNGHQGTGTLSLEEKWGKALGKLKKTTTERSEKKTMEKERGCNVRGGASSSLGGRQSSSRCERKRCRLRKKVPRLYIHP